MRGMEGGHMEEIGIASIKRAMQVVCSVMIEEKETLTEIDSKLGDGDMGLSMEKGGLAVSRLLDEETFSGIGEMFMACASAFNRAAPSTLGTLISFGLLAAAKQTMGRKSLEAEQVIQIPHTMAEMIAQRGKASVGDKTILDALVPFADTLILSYNRSKDPLAAMGEAALAAEKGMESTKGMAAKTGRAKWLDGRNREYPDAGAMLCVMAVRRLCGRLEGGGEAE